MNRLSFLPILTAGVVIGLFVPSPAHAAGALEGVRFSWPWALPFAGILLTIATGPVLFPKVWHRHYDRFALGWALAVLVPMTVLIGGESMLAALVHAALGEYLSFIVLIFALYVVAGGILVTGNLRGTPWVNGAVLALGTLMASIVGTTGAAMILIRPLLRANENRPHSAHVVVFFIFLVCNIGGALTPLGDPPLFIGYLHGVDFFWTARALWSQTLLVSLAVLTIFVVVDTVFWRREPRPPVKEPPLTLTIHGAVNFILIAGIIGAILGSAAWQPGISFDVMGTRLELQNVVRDALLLAIALLSLWLTPDEHRAANEFTFEPIREVAILFAAIFIAISPVLTMLRAGADGPFAGLLALVEDGNGTARDIVYFWMTGLLSAFLDNAPTYLVFFEVAGGEARELMQAGAGTLAAISMGAVYMGALTYIGNAPNFMVYAIASERGIPMPGFFAYMLWSFGVLIPVFAVLGWLTF